MSYVRVIEIHVPWEAIWVGDRTSGGCCSLVFVVEREHREMGVLVGGVI